MTTKIAEHKADTNKKGVEIIMQETEKLKQEK